MANQLRQDLRGEARGQGLHGRKKRKFVRQGLRQAGREAAGAAPEVSVPDRNALPVTPVRNPATGESSRAFANPYQLSPKQRHQQRQEFKGQGLRGLALKSAMGEYKKRADEPVDVGAQRDIVPENLRGLVDPSGYTKALLRGNPEGPFGPFKDLAGLWGLTQLGGYNEPSNALQERTMGQLGEGAPVDFREGTRPAYNAYENYALNEASPQTDLMRGQAQTLEPLGQYARQRLQEGGLTGAEESAIRGRGVDTLEGAFRQATQNQGGALAQAGIDPRSGVAQQRNLELERMRQQGRTGVERDITLQDLARKGQIENLAAGTAGLEEQARLGDVAAQLRRRGQYEGQLGQIAGLQEGGRRFDVGAGLVRQNQLENQLGNLAGLREEQRGSDIGYAESARQSRLAREEARKAAEASKPSDLEKAATIASAFGGGGLG